MCSYLELGALPTAVPCARLHARHLLWEWGLNGLAEETELLTQRTGNQRRQGHGGTAASGHPPAAVERQRTSPHRSLGCRPAAASTQRPRRRRHPRPPGRGRPRPIPGCRTEYALGLVPHPGANRQGRLVRAGHRTARTLRRRPSCSAGITARRIPREQQKQPIEVMRDPDVLRRLRDRLRDPSLGGDAQRQPPYARHEPYSFGLNRVTRRHLSWTRTVIGTGDSCSVKSSA